MNSQHHHKHIHPGRSSSYFFTSDQVLSKLGIKEGTKLLDAGCGDGFISIAASKLVGESGLVFAVDIDENSIDIVNRAIEEQNIENVKAIKADISKTLPLKDNTIDKCIMVNVFHGLVENAESAAALKEIKRVLKPGSTFMIIDFKKIESSHGPPVSIRLEPEEMESILRQNDFEKLDYFEIGKYHYGIVFSIS
jgi:ubiquinone/menaquinone biosynthesis C-methylase UbiE